jgi:predicted nucleic acid-binding protein
VSSDPVGHRAKSLVLDANILVRAILGRRVISLLENYAGQVYFLTPEVAYEEVSGHLPKILARCGVPPDAIHQLLEQEMLERLPKLVVPVPHEVYADLEPEARRRLAGRDEADWLFLALALKLDCPIWTEDPDFFGSGVATWTTDRIQIYLTSSL